MGVGRSAICLMCSVSVEVPLRSRVSPPLDEPVKLFAVAERENLVPHLRDWTWPWCVITHRTAMWRRTKLRIYTQKNSMRDSGDKKSRKAKKYKVFCGRDSDKCRTNFSSAANLHLLEREFRLRWKAGSRPELCCVSVKNVCEEKWRSKGRLTPIVWTCERNWAWIQRTPDGNESSASDSEVELQETVELKTCRQS